MAASPSANGLLHPQATALQYVGRVAFHANQALFQWPLTSVAVAITCPVNGTRVSALVSGSERFTRWRLALGDASSSHSVPSGEHNVSITVPAGGPHTLVLEHDAECLRCGPSEHWPPFTPLAGEAVIFYGFSFEARHGCIFSSIPKRGLRKVEAIGDSITCGFGNGISTAVERAKCSAASAEAQMLNGPREYLYDITSSRNGYVGQLARRFDAKLFVQCISGIGLCKNGLTIGRTDPYNISAYVDLTLPFSSVRSEWDYSKSAWAPDLLLINIGTNDYLFMANAPTPDEFERAYLALVTKRMAHYNRSRTKVLLVCGPMVLYHCPFVVNVVTNLSNLGYHAAFANASLPQSPKDLNGCAGHPDVAEARAVVDRISVDVEKLMGWTAPSW